MNDYSQYGEGNVISHYFKDKIGTLISLGENDGKTLSNVLGLIEVGWSAHLVEPSIEAFNKLEALHKGNDLVKCHNIGIAKEAGTYQFYHSGTHLNKGDTSLLSTIKKEETKRWEDNTEFKETQIHCITFNDLVNNAQIKNVDLISIDCEGVDFDILVQIDFKSLGVKMVCVEYNSLDSDKYIEHMTMNGFKLHYKNFCNLIFVNGN